MGGVAAEEIQRLVEAYDRCWLEGRIDDLRPFLHPKVVFAGPRFQRLAVGADACVTSYRDFLSRARVHAFQAFEYTVDLAEGAAVVTYRWTVDYEMAGGRRTDSGRDLLVWVRSGDGWVIAWRSQQPEDGSG